MGKNMTTKVKIIGFLFILSFSLFIFNSVSIAAKEESENSKILINAIKKGNLEIVKELIKSDPSLVNSRWRGRIPVFEATMMGRDEIVRFLVNKGATLKAGKERYTILSYAVLYLKPETLKFLIKKGANVNEKSQAGLTPLFTALMDNKDKGVKILLDNGANSKDKDKAGWTALHYAAISNSPQMIDLILKKGIKIDIRDNYGITPLALSVLTGSVESVDFLMKKGANIHTVDNRGLTLFHIVRAPYYRSRALSFSKKRNIIRIFKKLQKAGLDINEGNEKVTPPLIEAIKSNDLRFTDTLLKSGADVNIQDKHGRTPLHYAIYKLSSRLGKGTLSLGRGTKTYTIILLLIENEADPSIKDDRGNPSLDFVKCRGRENEYKKVMGLILPRMSMVLEALNSDSRDEIDELFRKRPDLINKKNISGLTYLHLASTIRDIDWFTEYLVCKGAVVNAEDESGWTPLHYAAFENAENNMKLLLEAGANINAKAGDGAQPIHAACQAGKYNAVKFLLERGANSNAKTNNGQTPMSIAKEIQSEKIVKLLKDKKIDKIPFKINKDKFNKKRAKELVEVILPKYHKVMKALEERDFSYIEDLFEEKPELLNSKNLSGLTFIHIASSHKDPRFLKFLIGRGANVNVKDKYGWTPLHYAAFMNAVDNMKILIDKGIKTGVKAKDGSQPVHAACQGGRYKAVKFLLDKGVNINAKNDNQQTPLHIAAEYGNASLVKLLISHGADRNIEDGRGRRPVDYAEEKDFGEIVKMLKK